MDEQQNQTIDIQEEVLKRYEELPDDLRKTMMSVETAETIFEIGKKFALNIEKTGKLSEEIGYIILGLVPSKNFINDLRRVLEVDNDKAISIASEVNHRIFLKIRETLKSIHGVAWVDELAKKPTELPDKTPFSGVREPAPVKPVESIVKDHEELPSILLEIKPSNSQPPADNVLPKTEEQIVTEIKPTAQTPETPTPPTPPAPPIPPAPTPAPKTEPILDASHEIAAPEEQEPKPPEGLPVETPISNQQPATNSQPQSSNKYLVDPYREPFE